MLLVLLAGCGAAPEKERASCRDHLDAVESSFRPLPKGLEYEPMPEAQMKEVRKGTSDVLIASEGKVITSGSGAQGVVLVMILKQPLAGPQDEEDFMDGFASTFGEGVTAEPVELPGGPATRMDGAQSAFVQVHDGCRVVTVAAVDDRTARRAAVAVLR